MFFFFVALYIYFCVFTIEIDDKTIEFKVRYLKIVAFYIGFAVLFIELLA